MIETNKYPPYVKSFSLPSGKGHIALYVHRSIAGAIAQNYVRSQLPEDEFFTTGAGFWIVEGFVFEIDLDKEAYPSLCYYLEEREGLELPRRFSLYKGLDESEVNILIEAYNATRRHILETQADLSIEEKKTVSLVVS